MIIYLVRHAESDSNVNPDNPYCGRIDDELTQAGREQAQALGKALADSGIDVIFSSPFKRTRNTAEIISNNMNGKSKLLVSNQISEINFGIIDGLPSSVAEKRYKKILNERRENKFQYVIPQGESYKMVFLRVCCFLDKIYRDFCSKTVLIVTHATTLKLFLYCMTEKSLEVIDTTYYPNTSLFKFELNFGKDIFDSRSVIYNSTMHLD